MDPLDALVRGLVADDAHEPEVRIFPVLVLYIPQQHLEGRLGELLAEGSALLECVLLFFVQAFGDLVEQVVRVL